jgi:PAS domain S-box-containing protein
MRVSPHPKFSDVEQRLLLEILENAPVAVWAAAGHQDNYAIRLWNSGAQRLYGYTRAEALGANYLELFVNELEREQAIADHERTVKAQEPYRNLARDVMANGTERLILTQGFPLWDPRTNEFLQAEIGTDVTEISGDDALWLSNVRATATRAKLVEPFTGVAELLTSLGHRGGGLYELVPLICDSIRMLTNESARCRVWKDGSNGEPILLSGSDEVKREGEYEELDLVEWVRESRGQVIVDYVSNHPPVRTGGRRRREPFPVKPVRPKSRVPFAALPLSFGADLVGVMTIYEKPGFEFEPFLRQVLAQFAKHAALGISTAELIEDLQDQTQIIAESEARITRENLVDDFSHQMRKIAGPIKLSAELLRERLEAQGVDEGALSTIGQIEARADELAEGIHDLATGLEPTLFDLGPLVLGLARGLRTQHADLEISYENEVDGPILLHAVRPFVTAAIKNVMGNGIEAMGAKGVLSVSIKKDPESPDSVQLCIGDLGCGIATENREKVWGHGFSTKPSGQGYGLWRTRQVVEQLGGKAFIQKSDSAGTIVVLQLPLAASDE